MCNEPIISVDINVTREIETVRDCNSPTRALAKTTRVSANKWAPSTT